MCHERFGFLWGKHEVAPMWFQCHMYFLAGQYGSSSLPDTFSCRRGCVVEHVWFGDASESHLVRMTGQCSRRGTPDTWAAGRPGLYDHFLQWVCGCSRCAVQCYTHAARKSWHRKTDDGEGCCACTARELVCQLVSLVAIRLRKLPCPCPLRYLGHVGNSLVRSIA